MAVAVDPGSSNLVVTDSKKNQFSVTKLTFNDSLSGLFKAQAHVLCRNGSAADWLGEEVTLEVFDTLADNRTAVRKISGIVTAIDVVSMAAHEKFVCFNLTIEPWLALLGYSRSSRVFQNKTTKEIVCSIFDELGFKGKYKVNSMPSTKREYCLQLDEMDLVFVSRLLAEEGVHFYFNKTDTAQLILHEAAKPFDSKNKVELDHEALPEGVNEWVKQWQPRFKFHAGSLKLANYDYAQTKQIESAASKSGNVIAGSSKIIDRRCLEPSVTGGMEDLKKTLLDKRRAQLDREYGLTDAETVSPDLAVGSYLKLATHNDSAQIGEYLITDIAYSFRCDQSSGFEQLCHFTCISSSYDYYPEYIAAPKILALHSAIVAGKKDNEPACDDQGRIRIRFQWDGENTGDKTSCWVRVMQGMAGSGYGCQFIPRAGQEVLISFLAGDPNQPVVTGSVFNSKHKVPYPVQNTTQTGIKTQLSGESNELRFDDKKDKEQLYMHAAKDMLVEVENDTQETITGKKSIDVKKAIAVTSDDKYSLKTKKDIELETETSYSLKAKDAVKIKGKTVKIEADDKLELIVGGSKLIMTGSKIEIKSSTISQSGSSKIELDGGQIAISGKSKVDIKSSAGVSIKATADLKASGLNAELSGSVGAKVKGNATAELSAAGQAVVKGAIVMVN